MIDLHCHLLPGIDDGPDTIAQSLALCRLAVEDGITHAVVTPHIHPGRWENTRHTIEQALQQLKTELKTNNIPLQLGFAGEVRLSDQLMQQVATNDIPFYGEVDGYQVMLLEFPHGHIIPGSDKLVQWLLQRNIRPLIAHPERNKEIMKDPGQIQPFIDAGCWLQLTGGSITGNFGERACAVSRELLARDAVTVVASDAHNSQARPPALKPAYDWVAGEYGEQRARRLMLDTPATLTVGQFARVQTV